MFIFCHALWTDLSGLELHDGQAEKVFEELAVEGLISQQGFQDLVRVFYKCIKATVMSTEISIKSKTLRRLEVGEARRHCQGFHAILEA